ncbi:LysE family translocator [Novosphingobium sp.]|uniref:LysE family translocator n=1 Tax=Novosphingobium sp. TaxID=1874826 RepID=UPI002619358B|nr:LysE family translocator [Novosphingobium sp.]
MSFQLWLLYCATVFVVSATPGPNMLHILQRSVTLGLGRSLPAMLGCMTGLLLLMAASVMGLTALLLALPGAFDLLRYVGTAYLVWLGIKAWRAPIEAAGDQDLSAPSAVLSPLAVFRGGFLIAISNPKALLFVAAFLPQFIDPARPRGPQFVILVASFAVIETLWYFTYALGGRGLSRWLQRPTAQRAFNRVTGTVFVGFGALLLRSHRA